MFWPIAAPRIYAASSSSSSSSSSANAPIVDGHNHEGLGDSAAKCFSGTDGDAEPSEYDDANESVSEADGAVGGDETVEERAGPEDPDLSNGESRNELPPNGAQIRSPDGKRRDAAILGLRVSRSGHIFATMTARTVTIWQTRVG
jgi:hypothetical protein